MEPANKANDPAWMEAYIRYVKDPRFMDAYRRICAERARENETDLCVVEVTPTNSAPERLSIGAVIFITLLGASLGFVASFGPGIPEGEGWHLLSVLWGVALMWGFITWARKNFS